MRVLPGLYTALIAAGIAVAAAAQGTPQTAPFPEPSPGYSFPAHETLTYAVDWRVFPAGTAVFHLQQQGDQERINASADTLGAINLIYRVSDR